MVNVTKSTVSYGFGHILLKKSSVGNFIFGAIDCSHMTLTTGGEFRKGGGDLDKCSLILILGKRGMQLYHDNRDTKIH